MILRHRRVPYWRHRLRPFATMAIVFGLVAGAELSAAIATEFLGPQERELTNLLNDERAAAGLARLPTADALRTVSRRHAVSMMLEGRIFHASNLRGEVETAFPQWAKIGENVGVGPTIAVTHRAFMDSSGHRANILDPVWQTLGIGVVPGGGRLWMAERFLRLSSSVAVPADVLAAEALRTMSVQRVAGLDRISTAKALVARGFTAGAATGAVLADAFDFHGALAGAALAGQLRGPVVLSETTRLTPAAEDALVRSLGADSGKTVHLIGTFRPAVVDQLRALGLVPKVHAGASAAGDAAAVALALPRRPAAVIVARDDDFPDALAAAAVAAKTGWPILFTATATLSPETRTVITQLGAGIVHVVGGPNAVSSGVVASLQRLGTTVTRHAGAGRVATALVVAELGVAHGLDGTQVLVATARSFPDALAGGPVAPQWSAPVVLTEPGALSDQLRDWLRARPTITQVVLLGGTGALHSQVALDLGRLG